MASTSNTNRVRIGGSGITTFTFGGQLITFCQEVQHTTPSFVGQGAAAIQPLDEPYPVEIITPFAAGPGTLVLNLLDLFGKTADGSKVWDRLGTQFGSQNLVDIVDIALAQAALDPSQMQIVKYVHALPLAGTTVAQYAEQYHGCVIVDVRDDEDIQVGTLAIIKQITVNYRYSTRNGKQSAAFNKDNTPYLQSS